MREVVTSLKNPKLVLSLFVTTLIIQVATGSIAPILTLYVRELAGNVSNVAFISGMIASVPGVAALLSAPRLGKLGDRIGPEKILITALIFSVLLLIPMSYVQTPLQLGILRFLLGAADGALLPAVQTLLVYNSSNQIAGRIFSYNQSFRDIGNVTGPLMGAAISANYGFRAVFLVTAGVVLFNAVYSWNSLRRRRIPRIELIFRLSYLQKRRISYPFLKPHQLKGRIVMTMYATLEEAIDAAREEFLADNPGIDAEDANVQQFNAQKYVLQDGDIMWQVEFLPTKGKKVNVYLCLAVKPRKVFLMATMMR